MTPREIIHRLLYLALIEIRMAAHESEPKKIFHLADLFHNIPLQLEITAQKEGSYEEILTWLQERADEKGCREWLDYAVDWAARRKE